jgi:hypothetical protein
MYRLWLALPSKNYRLSLTPEEPAQAQASNSFLSKELIELISSPRFIDSKAFLGYVCKILDLLIAQRMSPELQFIHDPNVF